MHFATSIKLIALTLAALSLGPSFAHVLEAVPRLTVWPPELWRETTVFQRQFEWFALVGAPIDVAAIIVAFVLCYRLRRERSPFRFALTAALLLAGGLASWFAAVTPANAILATWKPGPIAADFEAVRTRWEIGHMLVAVLKLAGFAALATAVALPSQSAAAAGTEA
jgi:hypothetical protein